MKRRDQGTEIQIQNLVPFSLELSLITDITKQMVCLGRNYPLLSNELSKLMLQLLPRILLRYVDNKRD